MNLPSHFSFELPAWVAPFLAERSEVFATPEDRMQLAIDLARENITQKTGGPFGAAIFDNQNKLIAPGINLVTTGNCSILHAEMVAIALAQQTLGRYDLSDGGKETFELAASCEPCAMCFGAVPWSGVKRLLCGARKEDAEAVGFDEGAKPADWVTALKERGIEVACDIERPVAITILQAYGNSKGTVY